jgi:hypothetical protein
MVRARRDFSEKEQGANELPRDRSRYTGLSEADSLDYGRWSSTFAPSDLEYVLPLWTECMRTGEPFRFEYRVKGVDDVMRWMLCQGR